MKNKIVIGTRKSRLALVQTEFIKGLIESNTSSVAVEVKHIVTKGDKVLDTALAKIGDKGLFTKELENELLDGNIDLAVHSCKDLPTKLPEGLIIGAMPERVPVEDALVAKKGTKIESLPNGARVGTSSLRRRSQLLHLRPDLRIVDLRGNVNTRVDKMLAGEYDAIVLAKAGLSRLGLGEHISQVLGFEMMLPAVGQGALAIETRNDDAATLGAIAFMEHAETRAAVTAERALMDALEGGCQVPIGAATRIENGMLELHGFVGSLDGTRFFRASVKGTIDEPQTVGRQLAALLLDMGAGEILAEIRAENPAPDINTY